MVLCTRVTEGPRVTVRSNRYVSYKDVKEGIAILYLSASKAVNEVGDLLFIWLLERHAVKARAIDRVGILNY